MDLFILLDESKVSCFPGRGNKLPDNLCVRYFGWLRVWVRIFWLTIVVSEIIITAGGENVAPIPIEDTIKKELPIVSNAMVIGDKKKFLSCLLTLKVTRVVSWYFVVAVAHK